MKKLLLIPFFLTSCAGVSPEMQAVMDEYRRTIPTCTEGAECERLWGAAQVWVTQNAGYRIQTATDTVIETFGPLGSSTSLAARVVREYTGPEQYRIVITMGCANIFGCTPEPWGTSLAFNRHINSLK